MKGGHGPKKNSYNVSDNFCCASDHAYHALQSLSDNYYVIICTTNRRK